MTDAFALLNAAYCLNLVALSYVSDNTGASLRILVRGGAPRPEFTGEFAWGGTNLGAMTPIHPSGPAVEFSWSGRNKPAGYFIRDEAWIWSESEIEIQPEVINKYLHIYSQSSFLELMDKDAQENYGKLKHYRITLEFHVIDAEATNSPEVRVVESDDKGAPYLN